jgi:hypothetical protein
MRTAVVVWCVIVAFLLFAYFAPVFYTGNYVAIPQSPVPSWSKVYGSLTCVSVLRIEGHENGSIFGHTPGGGFNPPPWKFLGILYQDGRYYAQCNPYTVQIG